MSGTDFDAIVVGGGHNGLTAAARMARSGARVLVLERRAELGGMASSPEVLPGLVADLAAEDLGLYRADLLDELELESHGLELLDAEIFCASLGVNEGSAWPVSCDVESSVSTLEDLAPGGEARRFRQTLLVLEQLGGELELLLRRQPCVEELGALTRQPELYRAITSSSSEMVAEWFESPALQGMFAALSVEGHRYGPRALGSGLLLLYQLAGTTALGLRAVRWAKGGAGSLSQALAAAATSNGAVVRTENEVVRLLVENARVLGVGLAGGEEVLASVVLSGLDARRTLLDLVGPDHLDVRTVRRLRSFKYHGCQSRLILRLRGRIEPPPGLDWSQCTGRLLLAPSADYVERAADEAKYDRFSSSPVLDVKLPGLAWNEGSPPADAVVADPVVTINAQYSPYLLEGGWGEDARSAWESVILSALEAAWPGVRGRILESRLLAPPDWEQELGSSEGSPHQGDMSLGQMFTLRSVDGLSGNQTPIGNLFLCGAAAHPGGGVTGLPGALAASSALAVLEG